MPAQRAPPRKRERLSLMTVRLTSEQIRRLDLVVDRLERPGIRISRSDALRAALEAGLSRLLEE
jgi:Arc/MetJ-type ribon-helix-helix transcriptional regulator